MKKNAAEESKLTALDKIVSFFGGDIGESVHGKRS